MKYKKSSILFAFTMLFISILACQGGSISTANISDAWLATDEKGDSRTTVFSPSDTFNLFLELKNAPEDTALKVSWYAVKAEGEEANTLIHETEYKSSDDTIRFYLTNDQAWPVGSYKVDVYLNGKLDKSLSFEVQ